MDLLDIQLLKFGFAVVVLFPIIWIAIISGEIR